MAIHGTSAWLDQPGRRHGVRASTGAYEERSWEGPTESLVAFLTVELPSGWIEYDVAEDGELSTVTAKYQAPDPGSPPQPGEEGLIERKWGISGNDIEKSLWEHPDVVAWTQALSLTELAELRVWVEAVVAGEIIAGQAVEAIVNLAHRLARGIEAFPVAQLVLYKREIVTRTSTVKASLDNLNRVFTWQQLVLAEPTLPLEPVVQLPQLQTRVFLKRSPTVDPTRDGLYELRQEYWAVDDWDQWVIKPVP